MVAEEKIEGGITLKDYSDFMSFSIGNIGIVLYVFVSICTALL